MLLLLLLLLQAVCFKAGRCGVELGVAAAAAASAAVAATVTIAAVRVAVAAAAAASGVFPLDRLDTVSHGSRRAAMGGGRGAERLVRSAGGGWQRRRRRRHRQAAALLHTCMGRPTCRCSSALVTPPRLAITATARSTCCLNAGSFCRVYSL